jgi:hypothetical protein
MVEANSHLKLLPPSILHIYNVFVSGSQARCTWSLSLEVSLLTGRNQIFFQGVKGATAPLFWQLLFSTDKKRGQGFEPPQIFGPAMETYCQRAGKHLKIPENAGKRRKTPRKVAQGHVTHSRSLPISQKTPEYAGKRRKNAANIAN